MTNLMIHCDMQKYKKEKHKSDVTMKPRNCNFTISFSTIVDIMDFAIHGGCTQSFVCKFDILTINYKYFQNNITRYIQKFRQKLVQPPRPLRFDKRQISGFFGQLFTCCSEMKVTSFLGCNEPPYSR